MRPQWVHIGRAPPVRDPSRLEARPRSRGRPADCPRHQHRLPWSEGSIGSASNARRAEPCSPRRRSPRQLGQPCPLGGARHAARRAPASDQGRRLLCFVGGAPFRVRSLLARGPSPLRGAAGIIRRRAAPKRPGPRSPSRPPTPTPSYPT